MDPKAMLVQRQIIENSKSLNDYYKDLLDWEKDINKKDTIVSKHSQNIPQNKSINKIKNNEKENSIQTENSDKKLKRDINSIGEYYKAWDKVDPDEELKEKDSGIISNNNDMISLKTSNAKQNLNIKIKNNRLGTQGNYAEDYIEKMKNEANALFAINNYNKSLELNSAIIKFIENQNQSFIITNTILNNRGNCFIKLNNFKEALKDFNTIIENDKTNMKAIFRRGLCHFNLKKFSLALNDFKIAEDLSDVNEKKTIQEFTNNSLFELNNQISMDKKKMERFDYNENTKFKKINPEEIDSELFKDRISTELLFDNLKIENKSTIVNNSNKIVNQPKNVFLHQKSQNIIKKEEIVKFIYDLTTENLTASSFKYAFRNFKNNQKEKEDYLIKINPYYIPNIFVNDLDREILNEIFNCLKGILMRENQK